MVAEAAVGYTVAEWETATIEQIAQKVAILGPFGSSIKVETFVPEGVPIISGQHLHGTRVDDNPGYNFIAFEHAEKLANANVRRGDIVFTHAGNIGSVAYIPETSKFDRYVISQRQFYMRCDRSRAIPEFVTLYFKTSEGQHKLLANSSQVGVPSIAQPVTYLRTIEIPLPPIEEQRAIANVLGTLDGKIELNRQMNATQEAMVRAIFKDWFVDFGPSRAKAEGGTPYLAPEFWNLFPGALDDGDKPIGWNNKSIGELCEITIGGLWGKDQAESRDLDEYFCLRGVDLQHLRELGEAQKVPSRFAKKTAIEKRCISTNDVLIASSGAGPCGRTLWIGIEGFFNSFKYGRQTIYSNFVKRLSCISPSVACFLDRHLNEMRASGEIQKYISGTSVPNLNDKGLLQSHQIILPSESLLDVFFEFTLNVQRRHFSGENATLAQTRDLLLRKLMSGEIRLSEAEKAVEAVI